MAEEINEFEKDVQQWQRKRKRAKNPSLEFKGAGGEMELGGSVTSFRKMYGYMGLRSIGSDQLDRFRTQRYNHQKEKKKEKEEDFASSRSDR